MAPDGRTRLEPEQALAAFATLNRRRLFGAPPLDLDEMEEWSVLRRQLQDHFAAVDRDVLAAERRVHARLPTYLRVRLATPSGADGADAINISQGGAFLVTREPLPPGTELRLTLDGGPRLGAVDLQATVTWTRARSNPEGPAGMGIRFQGLTETRREVVRRIVEDARG